MMRDEPPRERLSRRDNDSHNNFVRAMQNGTGALISRLLLIGMGILGPIVIYAAKLQLEAIYTEVKYINQKIDPISTQVNKHSEQISNLRNDVTRLQVKTGD